tara:strand:- start:1140 stop:2282 length:1143 start_codon:yes stop_codon:yes gene_type:complete
MRINLFLLWVYLAVLAMDLQSLEGAQPSKPARFLVVTVTTGFRHGSIESAEPVLEKIGRESGLFHPIFLRLPPDRPSRPRAPKRKPATTDEEWSKQQEDYNDAKKAFQLQDAPWQQTLKDQFATAFQKSTLDDFDGVMFVNTTGNLPIPDLQGFLKWLQSGKSFVGMHAATDTLKSSDAYVEMIGGSFAGHPWGGGGEHGFVNHEIDHPVVEMFPERFRWKDEIYQYDDRFNPSDLRVLLSIDMAASSPQEPWHVPVSWIRTYGQGRVFYTNLGHNPDTWENDVFQSHIHSGIRWSLGQIDAPSEPNPTIQSNEYVRSVLPAAAIALGDNHDALRAQADEKMRNEPNWSTTLRPSLLKIRSMNLDKRKPAYQAFIDTLRE